MRKATAWVLATTVVLLAATELRAPVVETRKGVRISITVIRGSKQGEPFVDEELGDLGEQIKKKFGLKRVEIIDKASFASSSGWELTTSLAENLKIKLKWRALQKDVARFRVRILREKETLIDSDQEVKLNSVGYAAGKLGKDALILMMVPNPDSSADDE